MPVGIVLTKMYGHDGHHVTGDNSKGRQGLMKKQFELSNTQAKQHSNNMPFTLRDAHPKPPDPRIRSACTKHHAADKLTRVDDTPAETCTVTKTSDGKVTRMKRCTDCQQYDGLIGGVVTDSKHPLAPVAQSTLERMATGTTVTSHDSTGVEGRTAKNKRVFCYSELFYGEGNDASSDRN